MNRIIITGGPTNEPIDQVMKITNMSTGRLSVSLGELFLDAGHPVCLVLNNSVNTASLSGRENLEIIRIETTGDMLKALKAQSGSGAAVVIHASAVGDYMADFSFLLEDLAEELFSKMGGFKSSDDVLAALESPSCKLSDDSKISSYQRNLTVKLGLTPKIISRLREWYPDSLLIGCKLLDNVSEEELVSAATELCARNRMDFILANDLAELRAGKEGRRLVDRDGFTGTVLETPLEIFRFAESRIRR